MEIDSSLLQVLAMIALSVVYYFIKKPKQNDATVLPKDEEEYGELDSYDEEEKSTEILEEIPNTLRQNIQKNSQNTTSPFLNIEISSAEQMSKYGSKFQKLEPNGYNYIAENEIGKENESEEFRFDPEIAVVYSEILKRPYS